MRLIREQLRAVLRQVATVADRGVRHVRALHSFPQSSVEQDIIQCVLAREVLTCHRPLPVRGVMHRVRIHPRDLDAVPPLGRLPRRIRPPPHPRTAPSFHPHPPPAPPPPPLHHP